MTQAKKPGWMRDEMPAVAAVVDELRAVFGGENITQAIREGMRDGTFFAEDFAAGKQIGVKQESHGVVPNIYRSPNNLPPMLEYIGRDEGGRQMVLFRGEKMSLEKFRAGSRRLV